MMDIKKYTISNDKDFYEAWPDLILLESGRMICVFSECTHHCDRAYTRIMLTESDDRGRSWTQKHPLTEGTAEKPYYYNCPRISRLNDGSLVVTVDRIVHDGEKEDLKNNSLVLLYYSSDEGKTWSGGVETPVHGIVPDKLLQLENGRLILSAHYREGEKLAQFLHFSDDRGKSWSERITVAKSSRFNLCEVSILPVGNNTLVAFLRENSGLAYDCKKATSYNNGENWGDIVDFPLPGCHRPVTGFLSDGTILITYRFIQGGGGGWGGATQNFFGALSNMESAISTTRKGASVRIFPIDYDRSPKADLGYSGWVQFPDGEVYIAGYIVDDASDSGQIRGYSLNPAELILPKLDGVK